MKTGTSAFPSPFRVPLATHAATAATKDLRAFAGCCGFVLHRRRSGLEGRRIARSGLCGPRLLRCTEIDPEKPSIPLLTPLRGPCQTRAAPKGITLAAPLPASLYRTSGTTPPRCAQSQSVKSAQSAADVRRAGHGPLPRIRQRATRGEFPQNADRNG